MAKEEQEAQGPREGDPAPDFEAESDDGSTVRLSDRVLWRTVDAGLIDGIGVNGLARAVRGLADRVLKHAHSGFAQSYVVLMIVGTIAVVGWLVR